MENTTFENHTFSIKKSISFGWMRTKQFWKMMLLIIITVIAITVPSNISSQYSYYLESSHLQPTPSFVAINILLQIITQIISIWLGYNIVKMGLKMTSGHTAKYKEMFHYDKDTIKNIWKYFLGSLLLGLLVILGLIL
ncbi:MAG: hypothetical protein QG614_247, partial [Patescibacteria group bacterium]|nr:hypothetical protein [Patescibacteria group bacterium]